MKLDLQFVAQVLYVETGHDWHKHHLYSHEICHCKGRKLLVELAGRDLWFCCCIVDLVVLEFPEIEPW
jgi:hypothetical protein